jgi:hypothetical protein
MKKILVNNCDFHIRISEELLATLRATGEPTTYAREVLMEHFNLNELDIKKARRANQQQEAN